MIVYTVTAQRYDGDKPVGQSFSKRYVSNDTELEKGGAATSIEAQANDEFSAKWGVSRKVIEAYRDMAASLGVRVGPGWALKPLDKVEGA